MKQGDIVFFKRAKNSSAIGSPEVAFKGYGFGLMLGILPYNQKDPPLNHILPLLGGAGFVSFDDVLEFLGQEQGDLCLRKFEEKYLLKPPSPEQQQELPLDEPKPGPRLVNAAGLPLPPSDSL